MKSNYCVKEFVGTRNSWVSGDIQYSDYDEQMKLCVLLGLIDEPQKSTPFLPLDRRRTPLPCLEFT